MASQNDLLHADDFCKFGKVMRSPFIRVEGNIVWWNFWCILYLKLSIAVYSSETGQNLPTPTLSG